MEQPQRTLATALTLTLLACNAGGEARDLEREQPRRQPHSAEEILERLDDFAPPEDPGEERFIPEPPGVSVESWVEGLEIPWSIVFVDQRHALVSERRGTIRLIRDGQLFAEPVARLDVHHSGEAGLLGLALHPEYPSQPFLYAMYTYQEGGSLGNRVVRLRLDGDWRVTPEAVVIDGIPGARFHDGGRIGFGPDGMLYVSTGDAGAMALSQDPESLAGKILRVTPQGEVPPDNPFPGSPIYALGLRNPQGLDWHPRTGSLFASDHGPSGEMGLQAHDEINVILSGANYGWPEVVGAPGDPRFEDPLIHWPDRAVPPGGVAFLGDDLFVATLGSEALVRLRIGEDGAGGYRVVAVERWFAHDRDHGVYGRFRDVVLGPDGALYALTSNRDGRGQARDGDDRILRITPR
jgi:glucose/arabinose dehydrogenase